MNEITFSYSTLNLNLFLFPSTLSGKVILYNEQTYDKIYPGVACKDQDICFNSVR